MILALILASAIGLPQEVEGDTLHSDIRKSSALGVDFLLGEQLPDGSWTGWSNSYPSGVSALCLYSLLSANVPPNHPAILRGFEYLRNVPPQHTYNSGFLLLALSKTQDEIYLPGAKKVAERLIKWQNPSGLWGYPGGAEDLSNALVAVLALEAASRWGIKIEDDVWRLALRGAEACIAKKEYQEGKSKKNGLFQGFGYRPMDAASGSMTAAGITIATICMERLGKKLPNRKRKYWISQIERANTWMDENHTFVGNPPNRSWGPWHLWGLERVGAYLNIEKIGNVEWYKEGASYLLGKQKKKGSWSYEPGKIGLTFSQQGDAELNTCMHLLFLNRASSRNVTGGKLPPVGYSTPSGEEVVLRAAGDTPMTIWVSSSDLEAKEARFFAREMGSEEWELIAEDKDSNRGMSTRYSFPKSGNWELRCEIETEGGVLKSSLLPVTVEMVMAEGALESIQEAKFNLFPSLQKIITASSSVKGSGPNLAFDQLLSKSWISKPDDSEPWIEIKIREKFKAKKLLFTSSLLRARSSNLPRPRKLLITINERSDFELEVPEEFGKRAVLSFSSPKLIRTLKIKLLDIEGDGLGKIGPGLAEIEAQ